ncbi:hypothetical protein HNP40_002488 [Mycobacteroides chelonae]|nr:hypothetical protein [Mycobacteroides chelonae]
MVAGIGDPTVVFESGMGLPRSAWGLVQPLVTQRFRSVVFDRANLGVAMTIIGREPWNESAGT